MYSPRPRPILKRHDSSSSPPNNTSHINNTAANTISNSHYHHCANPRSYTQNHHNYAPHNGLPNHTSLPMPITPGTISSTRPSSRSSRSCTVHFPPSPALTSTFACHSSTVYDRSPIVVVPNTCALPERGCPGRTYALGEGGEEEEADEYDNCVSMSPKKEKRKTKTARDRDFHPRALAFAAASSSSPPSSPSFGPCGGAPVGSYSSSFALPPSAVSSTSTSYASVSLSAAYYNYNYEHAPVPALVHDLSSESDESDGVSSLPAQITGYMSTMSLNMSVSLSPTKSQMPGKIHMAMDVEEDSRESRERKEKAHRRHRSRERAPRHERSSDPDRIPGLASAVPSSPVPFSHSAPSAFPSSSFASSPPSFELSSSPPSYQSPRKKGLRRSPHTYPTGSTSLGLGCGGFGTPEEGCLGGF
jgi:hypothetical protein